MEATRGETRGEMSDAKTRRGKAPKHKMPSSKRRHGQAFKNPHAAFREDMIAKKKEIVVHRYKKMLRKMGQGPPLQGRVTTQQGPSQRAEQGKGQRWGRPAQPWMEGPQAGKGATRQETEQSSSPEVEADYPEHLRHLYEAEEKTLGVAEPEMMRPVRKKKPSSYQKAKQEFERINTEKANKAEEIQRRKEEREKAMKEHKQRRQETFRMLSQKTKKGQPRLQLQMEHLLSKIQANRGATQ
ncbi:thyroid transcription factor 1-associated protein 26 [Petromyzon marinus]|uniref:thyroid transcription factor 1-associated protein 26 n=1 Tax=Petromyzon marinus TaxID=7757 RepID=UPI003F709489